MSLSMAVLQEIGVCAQRSVKDFLGATTLGNIILSLLIIILLSMFSLAVSDAATTYSTNIYTSTSAWQNDLITGVTTQFNTSVVKSKYDPNAYTINLLSENAPQVCTSSTTYFPCQLDQDIANLIGVSTQTGTYMWAWGQSYERYQDLQYMSNFAVDCINLSTTTFNVIGSTSVFDTHISSQTCLEAVTTIQNFIYQQNFSSPTVIPGF